MNFRRSILTSTWLALIGLVLWVLPAHAESYVREISYKLEQPFGNTSIITSAGQYIQLVYSYAAGIVGIIAVVLIMAGGMIWVTAAGNEQKISKAKEIITSAVIAVLIIVLSYGILLVINPKFVNISFSLQKISLSDEEDIFKLPVCTKAPYTGQTCVNESATDVKCDEIPCGEIGSLIGTGLCRGGDTSCGTGSYKCHRSAANPKGEMSCQLTTCGKWIDDCVKKSTDIQSDEYKSCLCKYYIKKAMPYFGGSALLDIPNYSYSDAPLQDIYKKMCEETVSNSDWPTQVTKPGYTEYYLGTTSGVAATAGFNCGFGSLCEVNTWSAPTSATDPFNENCQPFCGPVGNLPKCSS